MFYIKGNKVVGVLLFVAVLAPAALILTGVAQGIYAICKKR